MSRVLAVSVLALAIAGCALHPPLVEPSGPYRAMNEGQWNPTMRDLSGERPAILPAQSRYAHSLPPPPPASMLPKKVKHAKSKDAADETGLKEDGAAALTESAKHSDGKEDVSQASTASLQ
jgi:hypothetical protein